MRALLAGLALLCLDPNVIRRVIVKHHGEIEACYEAALERSPELEGRLAVRFTIEEDGHVSDAKVDPDSTAAEPGLWRCVEEKVRAFEFPKLFGQVRVVYPWLLKRGEPARQDTPRPAGRDR
jgi:hypothetical protein